MKTLTLEKQANGLYTVTTVASTVEKDIAVNIIDAPPTDSPLPGMIFSDNFSSGNLLRPLAGARFWTDNSSSFKPPDAKQSSKILVLEEPDKTFAVNALYSGSSVGARPELRFNLRGQYPELWIKFEMFLPLNYRHRRLPNPGNNKLLLVYTFDPVNYSRIQYMSYNTWPEPDGSSVVTFNGAYNYADRGHTRPAVPWRFGTPDDLGRWRAYLYHFKLSNSPTALNGASRVWRDGDIVVDMQNLNYHTPDKNYFDEGYIFGAANSGFDEDTVIKMRNIQFSSTPLTP